VIRFRSLDPREIGRPARIFGLRLQQAWLESFGPPGRENLRTL